MREFFFRGSEGSEVEHQGWLDTHPHGLVLSLNQNDRGNYTLHRPQCKTISYSQRCTGHAGRSGKICCENESELEQWLEAHPHEGHVGFERFCNQCPRS